MNGFMRGIGLFLALIAVGGIGAIHLAVSGYVLEASIVILLTVASLAPAVHRLRRRFRKLLREEVAPMVKSA